ncbi:NUDIX domain-containing protein [uncultured Microbacterium sp.]|uniref:NUDIX domain-containing protein n=1 Tax=uncultured Microbacterium sp. TaxID=191216 RepID=UPI0028D1F5E8|nr:NUDIX domain-containing protein [uncultured Microbacterium sp.]
MSETASSADRAMRALADAADTSRRRSAADFHDPAVPVAATVVVVRDGPGQAEVLMIERPDRGSFAGAWVFPGGKLEPGDGDPGDEPAAARAAARRETREETGLQLDAAALVPLSCWDPPPGLALRIRTWFFLAEDPGEALLLAPDEAVAAEWVRPADMLARHARGEVTLYPPTWVTLHDLSGCPDARGAIGAARVTGLRRFETVARRGESGPLLLWEGDAAWGDDDGQDRDAASRHRLDLASLPWVYTRTG